MSQKIRKRVPENPNSPRYSDPLDQITDLAGVRVITYFLNTVQEVELVISEEFDVIERIDKSEAFEKDQRLGYQSLHLLVKLKGNRCALPEYARFTGLTAEIQVRTILQHAWAEIEHDIQYKAVYTLPSETKRRFMALAGALEIADREFQAIAKTDRKLRDAALKSVAEDRLSGVEITPEALKAYLDKRYGADGRMSDYSYTYTVRLLKALGFTDLNELSDFLNGYDHDRISRALYGSRQGQLTRFEDALMVAAGREFLNRHPWGNRAGNEWFANSIEHRLKTAEEAGFSVGNGRLPNRQDDSGKG
ncbi:GTP pyrophosphokinase family protein [Streptomyces cyaneofuscatus]|uniref:GTP pyrophosphokinase n=1 Tax=Streptomyces cyaneofuscatus TaxID=66883 RepID=UPI00365ECB13